MQLLEFPHQQFGYEQDEPVLTDIGRPGGMPRIAQIIHIERFRGYRTGRYTVALLDGETHEHVDSLHFVPASPRNIMFLAQECRRAHDRRFADWETVATYEPSESLSA